MSAKKKSVATIRTTNVDLAIALLWLTTTGGGNVNASAEEMRKFFATCGGEVLRKSLRKQAQTLSRLVLKLKASP